MGYRYWRVYVQTNNGGAVSAVGELAFATVAGGPSVTAQGGTPFTNSILFNQGGNYGPQNAFDGNPSVPWVAGQVADVWIGWDFGAAFSPSIVEVRLTAQTNANTQGETPRNVIVQNSADNVTWTNAIAVVGMGPFAPAQTYTIAVPAEGGGTAPQLLSGALVAPTLGNPPAQINQSAIVVVMGETPPMSGGAVVASAAIVLVQVEFKQPYRNVELPLMCGPWAFPLWIAKGV